MINSLAKYSTWKFIAPFILSTLLFSGLLFPMYQNEMAQITEIKDIKSIDERTKGYTQQEVITFFDALKNEEKKGEADYKDGREVHREMTGLIDMIFPVVYGPMFILLFAYFLKILIGVDSKWLYASLFPVILMIVDYMENTNTLTMLDAHEQGNLTEALVSKASSITQIKIQLLYACFGLVVIGSIASLIKWLRSR